MKPQSISLLLASGLAVGMLASCVTPTRYTTQGETTTTTTAYQPGYQLTTLPSGYRSEVISGNDYYYHNGAYYRRESNGYVVVEAPRTSRYYSEYDRYRATRANQSNAVNYQGQRNETVNVVRRLPSGYRTVSHGGSQYYQSGENYYRRQGNGYVVVTRPY